MKNSEDLPRYPPLFFVRLTARFRNFLLRLNRRFTHPNVVLWEMVHNFWLAAGINVAAQLGIADQLKTKPLTIEELAELTGTHTDSLYRVMRMLSSHGIFRETGDKRFSNTPLSKPLHQDQIRDLLLLHLTPRHFQMFGDLMASVKTGKTVSGSISGNALFEEIGSDEKRNLRFNRAMTSATRMQATTVLSVYPFKKYKKIIDIGGGQGLFLAAILDHAKECKGMVLDLSKALIHAERVISEHGLEARMEVKEGDFFDEIPEGGDLYTMKSVLHDWNDSDSLRILHNVHRAMDSSARLLIIDSVIEEGNNPSFGKMTDILMMAAAGGRERTRAEFQSLLDKAGFRIRKIYPTISPHSLIEVEKF